MRGRILAGALCAALCGSPALAESHGGAELRLTPDEIAALPSVAPGAGTSAIGTIRMKVLFGDPNASGPYTIALDVPPNTAIKAHTHKDARTAVVVRGTWNFGYGDKADERAFKVLGAGSFYSEPGGVAHFAKTGPEGATVYISGWGPTDTIYVE